MTKEIADWQLADSIGSFEDAMRIIADRYRAGEEIPNSGYFQRPSKIQRQRDDLTLSEDVAE